MRSIRQHKLEPTLEDVPDRLPVDAGGLHSHVRDPLRGQPISQLHRLATEVCNRRTFLTLADDECLLRVRELRCLHRLPSSSQPWESNGKTLTSNEGVLRGQITASMASALSLLPMMKSPVSILITASRIRAALQIWPQRSSAGARPTPKSAPVVRGSAFLRVANRQGDQGRQARRRSLQHRANSYRYRQPD